MLCVAWTDYEKNCAFCMVQLVILCGMIQKLSVSSDKASAILAFMSICRLSQPDPAYPSALAMQFVRLNNLCCLLSITMFVRPGRHTCRDGGVCGVTGAPEEADVPVPCFHHSADSLYCPTFTAILAQMVSVDTLQSFKLHV